MQKRGFGEMEITPLGDSALIIRIINGSPSDESLATILAALRSLEAAAIPGVIELAPAFNTIGVFFDPTKVAAVASEAAPFAWLTGKIESVLRDGAFEKKRTITASLIEIPVCYDTEFGLDLDHVAKHAELDIEEVIQRHSRADYRVNCVGFTPGFPYLSGLPPELAVPRRDTPRLEVPAGSVAIGGVQTGIYPSKSPGGWNVIGRTPLRLFDARREPPALLRAGERVRFREITRKEFDALS